MYSPGIFCPVYDVRYVLSVYILSGILCPGIFCSGIFCLGLFCPGILYPSTAGAVYFSGVVSTMYASACVCVCVCVRCTHTSTRTSIHPHGQTDILTNTSRRTSIRTSRRTDTYIHTDLHAYIQMVGRTAGWTDGRTEYWRITTRTSRRTRTHTSRIQTDKLIVICLFLYYSRSIARTIGVLRRTISFFRIIPTHFDAPYPQMSSHFGTTSAHFDSPNWHILSHRTGTFRRTIPHGLVAKRDTICKRRVQLLNGVQIQRSG